MTKRKSRKSPPPQNRSGAAAGGPRPGRAPAGRRRHDPTGGHGRGLWIYGRHAALAALANPDRHCHRLLVTRNAAETMGDTLAGAGRPAPEIVDRREIAAQLAPDAIHQGIAVLAAPLPDVGMDGLCHRIGPRTAALVIILDQATDPQNVGAVLRSAAAFGADAVITQDRHAPDATGALAKAASGALETVPLIAATNLTRSMKQLKGNGFWCLGLDGGGGAMAIADADLSGRVALVVGAEGTGLRRLVRDTCDALVRIPISPTMESLNLSTASAVALYEWSRRAAADPAS